MDTGLTLLCVASDKLSFIVSAALQTLFICVLSIFNLSKGLSNIQYQATAVAESN